MAAYKLSKNDWVMPFFVIIRFTREKLLVTVSFTLYQIYLLIITIIIPDSSEEEEKISTG